MDDRPNHLRREVAAVAFLTAIGAVLRLWGVGRLGLTHFDEGIYALSGLWVHSPRGLGGIDPMIISYAPPGLPILIGLAYFLGQGPSDTAAIAVSLVAGILTIPVVAWLGRRTFGPGAGAAAAAFAAISGPHVAFSRMALTDATFLLAWLLAIGLGGRFLERPGFGRALAFGLAVGLAQNLKYHGWLAGAIVALGAWPALRGPRRELTRTIGLGLIAAATAAVADLPWIVFIDAHGGYARLLAHQRSYLGGVATWLPHLRTQLAQAVALSGGAWWGASAFALAWSAPKLVTRGAGGAGRRTSAAMSSLLTLAAGLVLIVYLPESPWWVGLAWLPWLVLEERPAVRILGVGFAVLSAMTPFYHPYARLWLPIHALGWLLLGGLIPRVEAAIPGVRGALRSGMRPDPRIAWACLVAIALPNVVRSSPRATPCPGLLEPTDGLRAYLGEQIVHIVLRRPTAPLYLLARPPIHFYLAGHVPLRTYDNLPGLALGCRLSDFALVDRALLGSGETALSARYRLGRELHDRPGNPSSIPVSVPTGLDESLDLPFKEGSVRASILLDFFEPIRPRGHDGIRR